MNAQSAAWRPGAPLHAAPGALSRVTGGLLLPVLTVFSAAWFSAMAIAGFCVWWAYEQRMVPWWGSTPEFDWNLHAVPRWAALALLVVVYAVIALPLGAARRAALFYANGGRPHGWADAWSGLLWLALVGLVLAAAWAVMPQLQEVLREILQPVRQIVLV